MSSSANFAQPGFQWTFHPVLAVGISGKQLNGCNVLQVIARLKRVWAQLKPARPA